MIDGFYVYRIPYDELAMRLDRLYQRKEVENGKGLVFSFEEPVAINLIGTAVQTQLHGTISLNKELPYSKVIVYLGRLKYLWALVAAIISASIGLYLVLSLWYVPALLILKAAIFWFYIKYRVAIKFASFIENLKKSLLD